MIIQERPPAEVIEQALRVLETMPTTPPPKEIAAETYQQAWTIAFATAHALGAEAVAVRDLCKKLAFCVATVSDDELVRVVRETMAEMYDDR